MRKIAWLLLIVLCMGLCDGAWAAKRVGTQGVSNTVSPVAYTAQNNEKKIPNMLDGQTPTSYYYTVWNSERTDDIPELAFYFNGVTLGSIWIRNGDYESERHYLDDARPHIVKVRIYTGNIGYTDIIYEMEDIYDPYTVGNGWSEGYQILPLPAIFADTSRVELYIQQWINGEKDTYNVNITDILFSQDGADSLTIATPAVLLQQQMIIAVPTYSGRLLDRMSTRSGPSTIYDELGTYFKAGDRVDVISKGYDTRNNIWWVQTEFKVDGTKRRAYTGLKRVDIDIKTVPEDVITAMGTVNSDVQCYWGPGTDYARHSDPVPVGMHGNIYVNENGFVQFEYATGQGVRMRRVWLPEEAVTLD